MRLHPRARPGVVFLAALVSAVLPGGCTCSSGSHGDGEQSRQAATTARPSSKGASGGDDEFFEQLAKKQSKYRALPKGRFRSAPPSKKALKEEIERLNSIGYAGATTDAPSQKGVTVHDGDSAYTGYNFYTSGHDPYAFLMDMEGNVLHRWKHEFLDVWPNKEDRMALTQAKYWRRARLLEDGSVLAIFEGQGIIKVDADSSLLWENDSSNAHHDLEVQEDGDIVVLGRKAHMVPDVNAERPVLEEYILVLSPGGKEKRRVSVLDCWRNAGEYESFWKPASRRGGDFLHTNTVHVLDEDDASRVDVFQPGHVLISSKEIHAIAVLDLDEERVVWAHRGKYRHQHDPKISDGGNLMLFDNRGKTGRSSVLEYELPGMNPTWSYTGTKASPFYSHTCGASSVLPNDNVLITETDGGRAFEVTREGRIVWQFYNPARAGDEDQYIATISEMQRLPPDFPVGWADNAPESDASHR